MYSIPQYEGELERGMDFRKPEYRRELWFRFYEFHLKYRAHPGAVYYLMPYLAEKYNWDQEQKLWYAFINGTTQNPLTSRKFTEVLPEVPRNDKEMTEFTAWFNSNWAKLPFDTDRRYQKKDMPAAVDCYRKQVYEAGSQADLLSGDFPQAWKLVKNKFLSFGRLATFSYLEYLRIMGLPIECDDLLLEDIPGSKSHRNGLCKVLGRDDLDWRKGGFDGKYTKEQIRWLKGEGELLLRDVKERFAGRDFEHDVGYFTMESTLCCFKGWWRMNRRYPNVYNDMLYDRLVDFQKKWPDDDLSDFWEARKKFLPKPLRVEHNDDDPGLCAQKQNHFKQTGEVILMNTDWDCFHDSGSWRVPNKKARNHVNQY